MVLHIDLVELLGKITRFDRQSMERMQGYLPVVICIVQSQQNPDSFLLVRPAKSPRIRTPPQETVQLDDTIESAARRCLLDELGLDHGYQFQRSLWIGHRKFPVGRRDERSIPRSLRRFFDKHSMVGKAYFAALITLAFGAELKPNGAEIEQFEWVDFANMHEQLRTNDGEKLAILARAWKLANPRNREELAAWLEHGQVNVDNWGIGEAKTIDDLWKEVEDNEILLTRQPLKRIVRVTQIAIQKKDRVLVEQWQEFNRGGTRSRGRPPAEKLYFGERPIESAVRCIKEELGIDLDAAALSRRIGPQGPVIVDANPTFQKSPSKSFPGLNSEYWFYRVRIKAEYVPMLDALPDDAFATDERHGPISGHAWRWEHQSEDEQS